MNSLDLLSSVISRRAMLMSVHSPKNVCDTIVANNVCIGCGMGAAISLLIAHGISMGLYWVAMILHVRNRE